MTPPTQNSNLVRVPDAHLQNHSEEHVLELDVPGVSKDDVELTFENGLLAVECRRTVDPTG